MKFFLWLLVEIKLYILIRPNFLFHPSQKQINLDHLIFIDGDKITRVESTKFLGMIRVYQNISWHAASYKNDLSQESMKSSLDGDHCQTTAVSSHRDSSHSVQFVDTSYLQYYSIVWAPAFSTHLLPLLHLVHTPTRSLKLYRFVILSCGSPSERCRDSESPKHTLALWCCNYLYLDFNSTYNISCF